VVVNQPDWVALYARVSGDRQEKEQTIETQLMKLHERVRGEGLFVYTEYLDNPYTGTVANRPALDRLMEDAHKGLFSRVLIYHPDRLARGKPWLRPYLEEQLRRAGAPVTYLDYTVEDSPEGRAKDGMLTVFAEWEREHSQQRMRDGKQRKLARGGNWHSGRAFGYRYVKPAVKGQDGHFEIVEDERPIVRFIFDSVLAGKSLRWIAAALIQQGVPTVRGGKWNDTRVRNLIHNSIYVGKAPYHRKEPIEPKSRRVAYPTRQYAERMRPRDEWKYSPAPAIVTEEEQLRAIAILTRNRVLSKRNAKHNYLLSGLVWCGYPHRDADEPCGRKMHGERNNGKPDGASYFYRCSRIYLGAAGQRSPHCRGLRSANALDELVWERLVALLLDPDELLQQMDTAQEATEAERREAARELQFAARALEEVQAKIDRLLDLHLSGDVDATTYRRKEAALVRERDVASELLRVAQERAHAASDVTARWDDVRAYCLEVADELGELDRPECFARKQELVRTLVRRIMLYPDRVVIEGALPCVDHVENYGLSATHRDARRPCKYACAGRPCARGARQLAGGITGAYPPVDRLLSAGYRRYGAACADPGA
jgi:site-specific DNA recombinase